MINRFVLLLILIIVASASYFDGQKVSARPPIKSLFPKTRVYVYNNLGNKIELNLHCKSKHDDLGVHVLKNGELFVWKFGVNILSTTRFTCKMGWRNVSGIFDIYLDSRDSERCNKCVWKVTQNGVRGYSQGGFHQQIWFRWSS